MTNNSPVALSGMGLLDLYDRFLNNSDPDIYNWITGQEPVPPAEDNEVVGMLVGFYK